MALTELLAASSPNSIAGEKQEIESGLEGFQMFGVVKETVDNEGLFVFHKEYFPFPVYKDSKMGFYKALGDRKLGVMGLFTVGGRMLRSNMRLKSKNISTNYNGEGLIQGGVIIFDKNDEPKYCYLERTGLEMPIDEIVAASKAIRDLSD